MTTAIGDPQAQLKEALEELDREKERRVHYQRLIYRVCNEIDVALGLSVRQDTGIIAEQALGMVNRLRHQRYEAERRMDGWAIAMRQANHITADLREDAEAARALVEEWDAWAKGMPSLNAPTEVWFLYTELTAVLKAGIPSETTEKGPPE